VIEAATAESCPDSFGISSAKPISSGSGTLGTWLRSAAHRLSQTILADRRGRRPEPVRAIHAAVRETSLGQPALDGLIAALRDAAAT
jgi:hypothetical protein